MLLSQKNSSKFYYGNVERSLDNPANKFLTQQNEVFAQRPTVKKNYQKIP